jgi:hypothetical protein
MNYELGSTWQDTVFNIFESTFLAAICLFCPALSLQAGMECPL